MYDKFYSYLNDLDKGFDKLAALLLDKLEALDMVDVDRLDRIIKEEQVYVLQSKGFERNIQVYKDQLRLSGQTLSQVIDELPEEERHRFGDVFRRLSVSLEKVKGLNDKCQDLSHNRLHAIDKAIKEIDRSSNKGYGDNKNPDDTPKMMNKSI
ncbi:MAG: flagellar protein FlgN [Oscillospiraceae bacterium]|nr:flagellar protein FlgN [Oscillospiraceae bacterium]